MGTGGGTPQEVLRSFFERLDDSPDDLATGPLRALVRHTEEIRRNGPVVSSSLEWHGSTVVEELEEEVDVDFGAARTILLRLPLGDMTKTDWYSGPARLRLVDGDWKVFDYKRNAVSMVEQIRLPRRTETFDEGVAAEPVVFEDAPDALRAIILVHNTTEEKVWAHEVALRDRGALLRLATLTPELDLEPTERRAVRAVWARRRRQLRSPRITLPSFGVGSRRWRLARTRAELSPPERIH